MSLTISSVPSQVAAIGLGLPVPTTQKGAVPVSSMHQAVAQEEAHGVLNDMQSATQSIHGSDSELLSVLIRWFETSESESYEERQLAARDRDYVDHIHYTAEELAILRKRGQPPLTINKVKEKIEVLRGLERRGRSDPKAFARTPGQDTRADVATQVLRYICDQNRVDVVRSMVFDNLLVEGVGAAEVIVQPQKMQRSALTSSTAMTQPDYDVVINHLPYDRIFWDPHSRHPGFSDARFMGTVIWGDRDQIVREYPGSENVLEASFASVGSFGAFEDRPFGGGMWADNKRTRVRLVQMHWKEADSWWTATFVRGGFVSGPMQSPYMDRHDYPTCQQIMRSAYIDRNNRRYGVARSLISMQDELNKRRSKSLWRASVRQFRAERGAVDDVDETKRELARPDGYVETNPGFQFEILPNGDMAQAEFHLLQHVTAELNAAGPNASMSGKDPRELSGRAIIAQQSGGQLQNEPIADELRQWFHKLLEAAWLRARQFWSQPRWIRITGDERTAQFVGLNRPITVGDRLQQMPPEQAQMIVQQMGLQPGDPRLQMPTGEIENDIDDMDVDITVEEGPDVPTMQAEQFQQIMQLPVQILQQFPPQFIIKASSLRNKSELLDMLEQHQQQTAAAAAPQQAAQHAMQAAQVAKANADAQNTAAQAADRQAQTMQRMHGIAQDHAHAMHTPIVPGVGPLAPGDNPLMNPHLPAMQQAQLAGMAADARMTDAEAAHRRVMAMERLHGMAMDHAQASGAMPPMDGSAGGQPQDQPQGVPAPAPQGQPEPPLNALMPQ